MATAEESKPARARLHEALEGLRRAINDLSADPTPLNVRRYLAASRLVDLAAAAHRAGDEAA
jgi:hypothetical protein